MQTFYFNTGVKPINFPYNPNLSVPHTNCEGQVWRNGTKQIPFQCEDVPAGAKFKYACDNPQIPGYEKFIVREIHNSTLKSKYAYFTKPHDN